MRRPSFVKIALISLAACALAVSVFAPDPAESLYWFYLGPFLSQYDFGNMINGMIPLIFGAVGIYIAAASGSFNLGGEGQIYLGAFLTAVLAKALESLGIFGGIIALFAACAVSGTIAVFCALMKVKFGLNELISTFMVSKAVTLIIDWLIRGPFNDASGSLVSTAKIGSAMRLTKIFPPSNLSSALFAAIAVLLFFRWFMLRTVMGYRLRMTGLNSEFASYGGIDTDRQTITGMFLSGALHGMAGAFMVFGTYYSAIRGMCASTGWNALTVALISGSDPLMILPAGLFYAYVDAGARSATMMTSIPSEISLVAQAAALFFVTSEVLGRKSGITGKRRKT